MRPINFVPQMESGGRDSQVDKLGYVPAEKRILGMLRAGIRFTAASAELFDGFAGDGSQVEIPPWRSKDFDLADGAEFLRRVAKRRDDYMMAQRMKSEPAPAVSPGTADGLPSAEVQVSPAAGKQGGGPPADTAIGSQKGSGVG